MANKIGTKESKKYTCQENSIDIGDSSLTLALNRSYEAACKDNQKINFGKFSSTFLTLSLTLFVSILTTSKYTEIFGISEYIVSIIIKVMCGVFFVLGLIALCLSSKYKNKIVTESRDCAVNDICKNINLTEKKDGQN